MDDQSEKIWVLLKLPRPPTLIVLMTSKDFRVLYEAGYRWVVLDKLLSAWGCYYTRQHARDGLRWAKKERPVMAIYMKVARLEDCLG